MKRQDEDLWMKKMREVLKDYAEPSVPDEWGRLEAALRPAPEKRIRPRLWWAAAAAVLVLAVSGISLFLIQSPTAGDICHTTPPTLAVTPDATPGTKEPEASGVRTGRETQPVDAPKQHYRALAESGTAKRLETIVPATNSATTKEPEDEHRAIAQEELLPEAHQPDNRTDNRNVVRPSGRDKLHLPVVAENKRASDGKWSVAASFSNAAGALSAQTQDYLALADMQASPSGASSNIIPIPSESVLFFRDGIPYLRETAVISEIKHKQPISFGLSVRKNLSKGFSVESGVTYTLLSSEGYSTNNPSQQIEQKLHYIGIPLRGNLNFVDTKRFALYVTAGGMVEKCVYGKVGSDKQTVKPLQFSLSGGVGGQLNITNRIGIYIEPGVSYFFDDGSAVETIRKETPFNFNLQGGIRFTY